MNGSVHFIYILVFIIVAAVYFELSFSAEIDYYQVLGLSRNRRFDPDEAKKNYYQLAKKFHPDKNKDPGAEDKYKLINRAYEVLSDDETRKTYDRHGEDGLKQGAAHSEHNPLEDIISQ